ncbi:MAG: multicopper oxidase domain-containing protein [Deferrisomatales bacterium]|nr:multicopper oxidase domain-containing protein [Deferrisomatales bacterium]
MAPVTIPRDAGLPAAADVEDTPSFRGFACDVLQSTDILADPDVTNLFSAEFKERLQHDIDEGVLAPGYRSVRVLRTPDRVEPDRLFIREFDRRDLALPVNAADGATEEIAIWGFTDPLGADELGFPSPTIRAVQGEVVHVYHRPGHGPHTIHSHGIGMTPVNDGVGHTTFELEGDGYIYQWLAPEPGTYLYHCHRNTVLHFEMGMYGLLIIDPPVAGAPFADGGPGFAARRKDLVHYDVEGLWVIDDIDRRWHDDREDDGVLIHGHGAGLLCPFLPWDPDPTEHPHLHRFEPDRFLISGVMAGQDDPLITHPRVAVSARPGDTILLRILNAAYTRARFVFPSSLAAEVIAVDGKALGGSGHRSYSQPFPLSELDHRFELTTAQRWDVLIPNAPAGEWEVGVEFRDWISGALLGRARTRITVG